jgi:PhnB protein
MQFNPYLFFEGRCQEALDFYRRAVGAEVKTLMRFKEAPDPAMVQPGNAEKIMHGVLTVGGRDVFVSDGQCRGQGHFQGFALTLMTATEAEAERVFNTLADGGNVRMALAKTFFSSRFGMLDDKFGVPWMVFVEEGQ